MLINNARYALAWSSEKNKIASNTLIVSNIQEVMKKVDVQQQYSVVLYNIALMQWCWNLEVVT